MSDYVLRVTAGPFKDMYVGKGHLVSEAAEAMRFTAKMKEASEARGARAVPVEFVEASGDGS